VVVLVVMLVVVLVLVLVLVVVVVLVLVLLLLLVLLVEVEVLVVVPSLLLPLLLPLLLTSTWLQVPARGAAGPGLRAVPAEPQPDPQLRAAGGQRPGQVPRGAVRLQVLMLLVLLVLLLARAAAHADAPPSSCNYWCSTKCISCPGGKYKQYVDHT